ncbi:uncharacterized protein LOC110449058 [Mizuhopecten yessoensis]|uniref:Poly [ADP-ribose] polymerase 12 n=1 Tax=Mizuhopecten yessoensis TaxID=6573 RepID=A0A210QRY2_MIZYE|nr:uncharacterized protein LOC110449058 [Mizuhopecten yessoensis]XP_021351309.1 uncharacterized protein LOC110449058 [Mizuhopecten yessoensis]XP_021351310.1 uncharacterized protein LOC110449058 [Mizuhopecten yessoensis]XP_021351311.1 uncharacterized protein LOC110449058 [Mizuhopecten yessoensis]XP_021351312.1 uncharacterized protein LOC110449058 [Mizuhopecten yessoensis]XP_021351313.1 uncharacterized protein LOC110449058 [Mizuhopecten yessoensis]XP_021351314.1 uncharacterized protein LOC11044
MADAQFFQRLKRQGVDVKLATTIVSCKQFTSEELKDWAIISLKTIKLNEAIKIVKELHFNQNVGDNKSGILCARINNLKKSPQEEAGQQGGHSKVQSNSRGGGSARGGNSRGNRGRTPPPGPLLQSHPPQFQSPPPLFQPTQHGPLLHSPPSLLHLPTSGRPPLQNHGGSSSQRNDGILPTPYGRKKQQQIQTDPQYLTNNLEYLRNLSENAQGIPGFTNPMESFQSADNGRTAKTAKTGRRNRGNHSKQGGATGQGKGVNSDEDSDGSIQSQPDNPSMWGNRGLNRSYGSTDFLDQVAKRNTNSGKQGNRGDQGNHGYQGNRGYQGDRNRGPRRGRGGGRGHHEGSSEIVNNNDDENNQNGRSRGSNRGQGRGRGRARERGRGGDRGRRWSSKCNVNSGDEDEESDSDSDSDLSSVSGSEASRSVISGSQSDRLKDFDKKKKRRRPRQKPRSCSLNEEVETFEDERVDENKIFSYLVKSFGGFVAFDEFVEQCDLFPSDLDIDKWFRCHKRRFKLFEKEGKILYVSAFYRDVTLCLGYNCLFGREKKCSKTDCEHFHICKNHISGNCSFGETCCFSHSFRDANNLEHKKKLGLHEFSDKEMVVILANRYPKVCSDFLKTTSCPNGENCPNLHICSLSLRGRCTREADCPLGHSFETDHNIWVLKALEHYSWLTGKSGLLLRKIILVDRSLEAPLGAQTTQKEEPEIGDEELKDIADEIERLKKTPGKKRPSRADRFKTNDPDDVISFNLNQVHISEMSSGVDAEIPDEPMPEQTEKAEPKQKKKKPKKTPGSKQNKKDDTVETPTTWLNEEALDISICLKYLEGNCSGVCPKGHHHHPDQAPYVWQIKQGDTWCSFTSEYSEEIEEGFCRHLEVIDAEILVENQAVYMVHVCVSDVRNTKGVVYEQDGVMLAAPQSFPVRRLSTQSYVDVKDKKVAALSFTTQWRWYWKSDEEQWEPFDTDNFQKTLERKYKYGQQTFLFTRENYRFKYRTDFRTFRQVNLDTMKTRDICRRPLFVSLEDVKNKKFPPCLEVVDPISKPPTFVPWDLSNDFELVELERVKPEFKAIRDRFFETMDNGRFDLLYIYRVQNWRLYQDYELRRKNMKKEIDIIEGQSRDVNEKFLFHGTDSMKTCQGICTNNFDFRTSGKNATVYGEGSYFAETSKYSHSYTQPGKNKERYMFQAKVLVGLSTKGKSSYRRPPERPGQTHKLYDSCVDIEDKPNMYIIFERSQSYPEYLIAYREKSTSDLGMANIGTSHAMATPVQTPAVTVKPKLAPKPMAPTVAMPQQAPKPTAPTVAMPQQAPKPTAPIVPTPVPAPRVSRAAPQPVAPLQPLVYPSSSSHEAPAYRATSSLTPLSYPTTTASDYRDNLKRSSTIQDHERVAKERSFGAYDRNITGDQMNQYYVEDQLERRRRATEYASDLEKLRQTTSYTPQQKKKDEGCVLQ